MKGKIDEESHAFTHSGQGGELSLRLLTVVAVKVAFNWKKYRKEIFRFSRNQIVLNQYLMLRLTSLIQERWLGVEVGVGVNVFRQGGFIPSAFFNTEVTMAKPSAVFCSHLLWEISQVNPCRLFLVVLKYP